MEPASILVVDDEVTFQRYAGRLLRSKGFSCDGAASLLEARQRSENRPYDLVLLDVCLGRAAGTRLLPHLSSLPIPPEVVVITAFPDLDSALPSIEHHVFAYLVKPVSSDTLLRSVVSAVAHARERKRLRTVLYTLGEARNSIQKLECLLRNHAWSGASSDWPAEVHGEGHADLQTLTHRERQITRYLLNGFRVTAIADRLSIRPRTVRNHLRHVYSKLRVRSQGELVERFRSPDQVISP